MDKNDDIVLMFLAKLSMGNITVEATTSTLDRDMQVKLMTGILHAVFLDLCQDYDAPSISRLVTQALISALDIANPDAANSIRALRRDSLPNLSSNKPGLIS